MDRSMAEKLPLVAFSKSQKVLLTAQMSLRVLASAASVAAASITLTNKETIMVFGIITQANYTYSPAFKFFAYVNLGVCFSTLVSLMAAFMLLRRKTPHPTKYFGLFVHDFTMSLLLMSGCAAATAVGQIGKYGNSHAGWMPICPYFVKYCARATAASLLAYVGMVIYFVLTLVSAAKSRQITL
ncbi:CASP-like protein 1F2 [Andrographis paniculata]|uniref:CASP-like protein 1F2 n=1 Tax=Andrographis paniculata TaxID=175694 RepID=UPI0021E83326|nr:CASP-like protein 1F2 [Andrographis paniculata]